MKKIFKLLKEHKQVSMTLVLTIGRVLFPFVQKANNSRVRPLSTDSLAYFN